MGRQKILRGQKFKSEIPQFLYDTQDAGRGVSLYNVLSTHQTDLINNVTSRWIGCGERQKVTFSAVPDAGAWRIEYKDALTADLSFDATTGDIQTALEGLVGLGNVLVSGDYATGLIFDFIGDLYGRDLFNLILAHGVSGDLTASSVKINMTLAVLKEANSEGITLADTESFTINHNFNSGVRISAFDENGDDVLVDYMHTNKNTVVVTNNTGSSKIIIVLLNATGTGTVDWGEIGGTLSNQTDLQNALNTKGGLSSTNSWTASNDFATFKIKNSTFLTTIAGSATDNRTITLPNASGTVPLLEVNNIFTGSTPIVLKGSTDSISNIQYIRGINLSGNDLWYVGIPSAGNNHLYVSSASNILRLNDVLDIDTVTSGDYIIRPSTTDGADNKRVLICGGGAADASRGGMIRVNGNEAPVGGGYVYLLAGTGAKIYMSGQLQSPETYSNQAGTANVSVDSLGLLTRVTSARKYKKNISLLEDTSFIYNIEPVRYQSKQGSDENMWYFGIVADQVDELGIGDAKMLVNYEILEDGTKQVEGFQYERLTVLLLAELQKLHKRVLDLEALNNV